MKKKTRINSLGFLLVETLLVSLTISGILVYMFVQFSGIKDSYSKLYTYDGVNNMYRLDALKYYLNAYMKKSGNSYPLDNQIKGVTDSSKKYLHVTNVDQLCNNTYVNKPDLCKSLYNDCKISEMYIAYSDTSSANIRNDIKSTATNKRSFGDYLAATKYSTTSQYRIFAIFTDNSIASIDWIREDSN